MVQDILKARSIFKNSFFSLSSKFFPLLISLFSIPIIIRNIGEERFGILAIAWAFIGYFNFFDFGLGKALTKSISEKLSHNKLKEIPDIFSTALTITSALGILGGLIFFLLSKPITLNFLKIDEALINEVLLGLTILSFGIPFVIISSSLRGCLEAYHAFKRITKVQVVIGSSTYLGLIVITYYFNSIAYLILWLTLQKILLNLYFYYQCYKNFNLTYRFSSFKKEYASYLFSFGGWITVSSIIAPIIETADRLIIGAQKSMTNLAYYSVPIDLIKRLGILPSSISLVLFPIFSREVDEENKKKLLLYNTSFNAILFASTLIVFLLISLSKEIISIWINPEFSENAFWVLQIIAVGGLFNFLARIPLSIIQGSGRPDISAKFHLIELPIYIIILFVLTKLYGINGAASATAFRMILDFTLLHIYSVKYMKVHHKLLSIIFGSVLPVLIAFQVSILDFGFLMKSIIATVLCLVIALIYWIYIFDEKLKSFLKTIFLKIKDHFNG